MKNVKDMIKKLLSNSISNTECVYGFQNITIYSGSRANLLDEPDSLVLKDL
jgi:hypothetical protein